MAIILYEFGNSPQIIRNFYQSEKDNSLGEIPEIVVIKSLSDFFSKSYSVSAESRTILICTDENCKLNDNIDLVLLSKSVLENLVFMISSLSGHRHTIDFQKDLIFGSDIFNHFSDKEIRILKCLSNGLTNNQIAKEVGLKPNTIKGYLQTIFIKLNAKDRAHAVSIGIRAGLI